MLACPGSLFGLSALWVDSYRAIEGERGRRIKFALFPLISEAFYVYDQTFALQFISEYVVFFVSLLADF